MFSAEFQDYDAYADAIQRVDARFMLQNLEKPEWRIDGLVLPAGITIQHCWSGSGAIARGVSADAGVELAIPATGYFVANGERVPRNGALLISPDDEFVVSIPGIHRWFNVCLTQSQAHAVGLLEEADGCARIRTGILRNQSQQTIVIPAMLMRLLANLCASPEIAGSEDSHRNFQAELLTALGAAYGSRPEPARKHRGRAPTVDKASILLAVDAIEASAKPVVSLSELVRITQLSERSLRAGFQKYLGLSPTRYMQLSMLDTARQRLSTPTTEKTTVARVAADLGVWDLGRFAKRYQRAFGELPSATLRQTRAA